MRLIYRLFEKLQKDDIISKKNILSRKFLDYIVCLLPFPRMRIRMANTYTHNAVYLEGVTLEAQKPPLFHY